MATAEGKPLYVAAGSASAPPAASGSDNSLPGSEPEQGRLTRPATPRPRRSPPRPAGGAGVGLSPEERRRLAHLSPAAIAAVDRVVAKLSDRTAETRHAAEPGQEQVHFRRRQKTLAVGR